MLKTTLILLALVSSLSANAAPIAVGTTTAVFNKRQLPKAQAGTKWVATGNIFQTRPMQYEYRLQGKLAKQPSAPTTPKQPSLIGSGLTLGQKMSVFSTNDLPTAPTGTKWKATGQIFQTMPMQFEYQLSSN